jgi:hypothetical protein
MIYWQIKQRCIAHHCQPSPTTQSSKLQVLLLYFNEVEDRLSIPYSSLANHAPKQEVTAEAVSPHSDESSRRGKIDSNK